MATILDAAYAAYDAGLGVLSIKDDGSKAPTIGWTALQKTRVARERLPSLFPSGRRYGLAVTGGKSSGNIEILDFDDADFGLFVDTAHEAGLGDLVSRLLEGFHETTPSGGHHLVYRCETVGRNLKLAQAPGPDPDRPKFEPRTLIEARGEGGYAIVAPTSGTVHENGGSWELVSGGFDTIPTITPEERADLFDFARSFDDMPPDESRPKNGEQPDLSAFTTTAAGESVPPGTDFRDRHGKPETFRPIIEAAGWTYVYQRGDVDHYRRPGKGKGISATFGFGGSDYLIVFTSSTAFEAERAYNPFSAYAVLHHGGDFSAAAKALRTKGYGTPAPTPTLGGKPIAGARIEEEIPTPDPAAGRVDIEAGDAVYLSAQDQHTKEVTRQAWDAIIARNTPPATFIYANRPTRLVFGVDGMPIPEMLDERKLSHLVARSVVWYRTVAKPKTNPVEFEHRHAHPPLAIVKDMIEETAVGLPILSRIVQAPAYAADGSLSLEPGYHPPSESYYVANGLVVPPIPDDPTGGEIEAARRVIADEVFGDFPFVDDADRAHAFAMLLQAFVRSCISGTTPLYTTSKPRAGTGATLLVQVVALITSGQPSATMTLAKSDDEMRKRLTSTLRGLPLQILLDNVRGTLDHPSLAAVLTARVWGDRILGESNNVKIPVSCTFSATGNNIAMSDEIARRSVPIRLDAQVERPDTREGWRHDNLEEWVLEHRGELVAACLTLCQAWFAAGRPKPSNNVRLGGFESWSRTMAGILEVAGVPDFLSNLRQFRDRADVTTDVTRAFLERWWSDRTTERVTIKELIPAATDVGVDLGNADNERSLTSTLGRFVKRLEGQRYTIDNDQLVRVADAGKDGHTKAQLWMLDTPIVAELAELAEPFQLDADDPQRVHPPGAPKSSTGIEQKSPASSASSANERRI